MAQPQRSVDVYQDELCPPNKHYALMYANKKINLDNPLYPNESKIIANINQNHPLRARDKYHNLEDNAMVKNIFNSGKHKDSVGMKIPSWVITDEMKLTDHYRMYAVMFGVDIPMTQSQPIKSTQGTHMTLSAPRSPNPEMDEGESSTPRKSTVIRLHIIQLSLAEQKSHDELEAQQNVQKVKEHLIVEEIEKLVEGAENVEKVEVNSSTIRQDDIL
ncbi:hypothetical protein Tco_0453833 [Tanacetum coccineum]